VRTNQLVGYGIVVGLEGTGDSNGALFTVQSVANMLERFGITVPPNALKVTLVWRWGLRLYYTP
jgi:flagellar P-ring protein precursor FlgI